MLGNKKSNILFLLSKYKLLFSVLGLLFVAMLLLLLPLILIMVIRHYIHIDKVYQIILKSDPLDILCLAIFVAIILSPIPFYIKNTSIDITNNSMNPIRMVNTYTHFYIYIWKFILRYTFNFIPIIIMR